jgi:hypothetical protein
MPSPRSLLRLALVACLLAVPLSASAQESDRLFLSFIEDAALVNEQWWEGQLEFENFDSVDTTILRGVVAFQPWKNIELGGRVGFGDADVDAPFAGGSGATDLEAYAKYRFGEGKGQTRWAVGSTLTVPTGDDSAGLGTDAWALSLFGAFRYYLQDVIISTHAGFQFNGDGSILGFDLDGDDSILIGGAAIVPLSDQVNLVGELDYQSGRFVGAGSETSLLGGINWRVSNRGIIRGAIAVGLSDDAPDAQIIGAYAFTF